MKLVKEIKSMYGRLSIVEQEIFNKMFGVGFKGLNSKKHKEKEIIYNLLLWRTADLARP